MRALPCLLALLTACAPAPPARAPSEVGVSARDFVTVVARVEPVAEAACRAEPPDRDCDFRIVVNRDPRAGANAFQTADRRGRPVIIVTAGLIAEARSADELAFVLGHEAGHHIARHLEQQDREAAAAGALFGRLARAQGATDAQIGQAAKLGAFVAARRFSQGAELEADAIGAAIALRAGFDPLAGAAFFGRLPDPDDAFLSTHPPSAARMEAVARAVADLR